MVPVAPLHPRRSARVRGASFTLAWLLLTHQIRYTRDMSAYDYNPPDTPLDVVHVDDWLLVLNKPAGLLSVPGKGDHLADCLHARAALAYSGARLVHRLDRDTSGLIVFGRSHAAQVALNTLFSSRQVSKTYLALVGGNPAEDSGHIDLPIIVDWPNRPRQMICHDTGRPSQTNWKVLRRWGDKTLMELTPLTGRSHQLRLHMLQIGHPILGDTLYAPPELASATPRMCLHAAQLGFVHPSTGEAVSFTAPADFVPK